MGKALNFNHISEVYCPLEISLEGHIKFILFESTLSISFHYHMLVVYEYAGC